LIRSGQKPQRGAKGLPSGVFRVHSRAGHAGWRETLDQGSHQDGVRNKHDLVLRSAHGKLQSG
jgi:hypothetical protein